MIIKSQKLRAVGIVAGMLGIGVSAVVLLRLAVTYITPQAVPFVIGAVLMGACVYVLYRIALAQIQYEDKLKDLVDRK
jgi:hypothetical protein